MATLPSKILTRIAQEQKPVIRGEKPAVIKFRIYRLALIEIGEILKNEELAMETLEDCFTTLNQIENGFMTLTYDVDMHPDNVRDIKIVRGKLIRASANLGAAKEERSNRKSKTQKYYRLIKWCKFYIGDINEQLKS